MGMEWTDVTSSQIEQVGYDEETSMAGIRFSGKGREYEYYNVPKDVTDAIISAASPGQQFNQTLKYGYAFKRVS